MSWRMRGSSIGRFHSDITPVGPAAQEVRDKARLVCASGALRRHGDSIEAREELAVLLDVLGLNETGEGSR